MNIIRSCLLLVCLVLIGCQKGVTYEHGTLHCPNCNRVIYDGDFRVEPNGFTWPVGEWHHCPVWDITCIPSSEYRREFDREMKTHWGYEHGRTDALELKYHKEFDPKVHHPLYVEHYKRGYKEVIDVRGLPNEKKVVE